MTDDFYNDLALKNVSRSLDHPTLVAGGFKVVNPRLVESDVEFDTLVHYNSDPVWITVTISVERINSVVDVVDLLKEAVIAAERAYGSYVLNGYKNPFTDEPVENIPEKESVETKENAVSTGQPTGEDAAPDKPRKRGKGS